MSRTIVIYYTFEGNSGFAAETAAALTGADSERLRVKNEPPKSGLRKFLVGGGSALRGADPVLEPVGADLAAYDRVILAFPIWAGTFPPAVGAFLDRHSLAGKELWVIASSASGKAGKSAQNVAAKAGAPVRGVLSLLSPLKHKEQAAEQIREFVRAQGLTE